jgi:hypothetical protein
MPTRNWRLRIALDRDQLAVLVVDKLPAAHATIRTNRPRYIGAVVLGKELASTLAHGFRTGAVGTCLELPDDRPAGEKVFDHSLHPVQ